MRKSHLFIATLAAAIGIYGCTKSTTEYYTTNKASDLDSIYIVNGVTDVTMYRNSMDSLMISVNKPVNKQDRITLAIAGVPQGITAEIKPASGYPPFDSKIVFTSGAVAVGNYPITITASTDEGVIKTFNVTLKVAVKTDCSDEVVGTYTATSLCTSSGNQTGSVFISMTGTKNKVQLNNLWPVFNTVNATVDCSNSSITVPTQILQFSGQEISGTGTYNTDSVIINYTITNVGGGSETCTTVLKH